MKFGRNLPQYQVPEWSGEYIDYKGLKKLVKAAAEQSKQGSEADLAEFFFILDRNLENVDYFYNKKYTEALRRLKLLLVRVNDYRASRSGVNHDEIDDLVTALLELRSQLRKLQWYGEVNRRGFVKITKKLDKKVRSACAQQRYMVSRVNPKPFATNTKLTEDTNSINDLLSQFGDFKAPNDTDSTDSSFSLTKTTSESKEPMSEESIAKLEKAIRTDSVLTLTQTLGEVAQSTEDLEAQPPQTFLLNALHHSISNRATKCISSLLKRVSTLEVEDDLNQRNCIHRFIIGMGKARSDKAGHPLDTLSERGFGKNLTPAEAPVLQTNPYGIKEIDSSRVSDDGDDTAEIIIFLLDELSENQRFALKSRDAFGRLPLHYAAKYGFVNVCEVIIIRMIRWKQLCVSDGIDNEVWQDFEGHSPLHLSVIGGWRLTTEKLLHPFVPKADIQGGNTPTKQWCGSNLLLSMATKVDFSRIVALLVQAGADINYRDKSGETALHVAARFNHVECARALIQGSGWHRVELDIPENTFGWTPLLVASVDGNLEMAKILAEAGCEIERKDTSGWTAREHAALRGHIEIATFLTERTSNGTLAAHESPQLHPTSGLSLEDRASGEINKESPLNRPADTIKSFGHRYLTNESMVLVSLGSMDSRKTERPVQLDSIPIAEAHATQLDTALSVVVSASNAAGEPTIIDLPVQENISTEPIAFTTKDITKVKVLFDIVPTYAGSRDHVVGRGVAMLSSMKPTVGTKRMNLQGDVSVPVLSAKTLDMIGTVNFNFLIITPFFHPNMSITESHTYWKRLTAPMVIGHRGLGKNLRSRKSLQLGENTMQSFIAAANLGASYVEFDVQLTKDHVPVIYHDFLVSETGIDAPVHTLTLEQFLHVNESTTPQHSRSSSPVQSYSTQNKENGGADRPQRRYQRAHSMGHPSDLPSSDSSERMKHTRDFKLKGYKGNSRGNFIQAPFTTLEEMLRKLPEGIGFNIEMKYPMLFESEQEEMDSYAVELNSFVDTVLKMVYDLGGNRNIIFSSFHPDICLLLSLKQPSIPILFLTDAGTWPVGDVRASSLQEAIRFASRWNLLGVVAAAEPLVMCPRLVRVVKESGLVCVSYGTLNNDPKHVKSQVKQGIDAVIVDSVLAVRKGLTARDTEEDGELTPTENGASGVPLDAMENRVNINGHVKSDAVA